MISLSYWEQDSLTHYDYAVIGGGLVGLSTAAALLEQHLGANVLVLERGLLPTGASTRNAGFACIGSPTELLADIRRMGEADAVALVCRRYAGLLALRRRLGDAAIGYEPVGGYELLPERDTVDEKQLAYLNQLLAEALGEGAVYTDASPRIREFGFAPNRVASLIFNRLEGSIDTGKMMHHLWAYTQGLGARIITGAQVQRIEDTASKVLLHTAQGWVFEAKKVAVCTNGFTSELLPDLDIKPGRGQVLITQPLNYLPFTGTFHFDEGYYYFRNVGSRLLFGGGRNLDFEGETTTEMQNTEPIIKDLLVKIKEIILPNTAVEIAQTWAGIMAFSSTHQPIEAQQGNITIGTCLNGMGVALGSLIGESNAARLLGKSVRQK